MSLQSDSWKSFLAPTTAALVGSVIGAIISGAAAIFVSSQAEKDSRYHESQIVEARLSVVETELKELSDFRHDVMALQDSVTRISVQLDDMRASRVGPHQ